MSVNFVEGVGLIGLLALTDRDRGPQDGSDLPSVRRPFLPEKLERKTSDFFNKIRPSMTFDHTAANFRFPPLAHHVRPR